MALKWETSPVRNIGIPIQQRAQAVPQVVFQVGLRGGAEWSARAQQIRPWTDRTNYARAGLSNHVAMEGINTVIQVYHQAEYGVYLETGTRYMRARSSILPAMNMVAPQIIRNAQLAVQRTMAGGRVGA